MPRRLQSLDALRGFDMLFIMGGAGLIASLAPLFPCGFTQFLAEQMGHVAWNGLAHHDTIFPLFLFIAGVSFPFSLEKQRRQGKSRSDIYKKILRRGGMLVALGVVYNGFLSELDLSNQRYASVLAHIGLGWMFGALIFMNTTWKTRLRIVCSTLVAYWLVTAFAGRLFLPDADPFSREGCIQGYIDRLLLPGQLCYGDFDPEGLLSTIPTICTALLGMFAGEWVKYQKEGLTENKKVLYMVCAGVALLAIGLVWSLVFPINKMIWSSSFVCVTGAYSVLMFSLFYYLIDVRGHRRGVLFFTVIGMNSITIYLAQVFIPFNHISSQIFGGTIHLFPETAQPLLGQATYIAVCWLSLYFLYRKRVFLKV